MDKENIKKEESINIKKKPNDIELNHLKDKLNSLINIKQKNKAIHLKKLQNLKKIHQEELMNTVISMHELANHKILHLKTSYKSKAIKIINLLQQHNLNTDDERSYEIQIEKQQEKVLHDTKVYYQQLSQPQSKEIHSLKQLISQKSEQLTHSTNRLDVLKMYHQQHIQKLDQLTFIKDKLQTQLTLKMLKIKELKQFDQLKLQYQQKNQQITQKIQNVDDQLLKIYQQRNVTYNKLVRMLSLIKEQRIELDQNIQQKIDTLSLDLQLEKAVEQPKEAVDQQEKQLKKKPLNSKKKQLKKKPLTSKPLNSKKK